MDNYNGSTSSVVLYEPGFGFGRDWGCAFAHAPPLQEFGDMLTRSITNRIQSRDGKRICTCWCIYFVVCVGVRVGVSICVSLCARVSMHGLPTRVRSHFTTILYDPGTLGSRSCDNDGNCISKICFVLFIIFSFRSFKDCTQNAQRERERER